MSKNISKLLYSFSAGAMKIPLFLFFSLGHHPIASTASKHLHRIQSIKISEKPDSSFLMAN
jgi:hypothetical protein